MYIRNLLKVIKYLEGKLDIYDGKHEAVIQAWNNAWDEMKWLNYDPESASSIKSYIRNELEDSQSKADEKEEIVLQFDLYGYLEKAVPIRHEQLKEKHGVNATALEPSDSQKSFYNKAYVLDFGRYQKLLSYETIVCVKDIKTGKVYRTWDDFSATTGRHIRAFCGLNKHEYLALPYVINFGRNC